MAKNSSSSDSSLRLHEVLEAEFVALHGELPSDYPSSSDPDTRLKALWGVIHGLKEKRAAFCISGGGIRSATFGLGILQGLARCGLLDKFHYLSTVSGGGYIGSWLSAWIKNDPNGIRGVVGELKRRPDSTLEPEPQPIRHLREFSNYLAPKAGLTSVDFWTLIATFIRNMFLNWLVLISLLAAAMMIPRLYLAAINLQPDWSGLATLHSWYLSTNNLKADWTAWDISVKQPWDIVLAILLAVGLAMIAVAMAYAIIDVPSTGNARLSQRRFLILRQLPLFLASLILAGWWALFRNVHGSDPYQPEELLPKFVAFFVASYLSGEVLATVVPSFRKREQKTWPGRVSRFVAIGVTAAFAGFCVWAMATRLFLDPKKIEFTQDCEAKQIPSGQNTTVQEGTKGLIKQVEGSGTIKGLITEPVEGRYIIATPQGLVRIAEKDLNAWQPKFKLARDCEALETPSGRKTTIQYGTNGQIKKFEGSYTVRTDQGLKASIAKKDFYAFQLNPVADPKTNLTKFTLTSDCDATAIPGGQEKKMQKGINGQIEGVEGSYVVKMDPGFEARIAEKDLDAFQLNPVPAPANDAINYVCFAPALIMAVLLLVNFLFTGLASWVTEDEDREWWARSAAWILITIFGWLMVNLVVLWGAQAISTTPGNQLAVFLGDVKANRVANAILGAFGGVTGIVGALLALRSKLSKKLGRQIGSQWPLVIAAVVFFVLLAIVISWVLLWLGSQPWSQHVTAWLQQVTASLFGGKQYQITHPNSWRAQLLAVVTNQNPWNVQLFVVFFLTSAIAVFGALMGLCINANKFSLHATYRNRLIRAYLAASRTAGTRKPSLFTGFDPADNFALCELSPEKPLHLLNGALNLVRGEQLAWQERKAESFTMSRLHCGCFKVGYRPSPQYGEAITLGTAMAISGAAANPNMGYHSSPVLGLLMTLFNVRLGWWLGNPGARGAKTWRRSGPGYSVGPLFSEALGNTTDHAKYVNLSDGGHFENLGLYEMVLRRCHYIVVSDAGEDLKCSFADLGEAVRKIRIDFGIPIEFGPMSIYPRSAIETLKTPGHNCAIGRIRYSVVDGDAAPNGVIVYIKPACYGDEPRDIYEYFKTNPTFPHESTSDQFFSESQFESYRMLGAYTMEKLCTDCGGDFRCFVRDILKRHLDIEAPDWLAELLDAQANRKKGRKRLIRTCVRAICGKLSA
jgi:patatin-like phospholipase